jgi:hypothetical protein
MSGYFGEGDGTDLLFYDADAGIGDFYTVSDGGLEQLSSNTGWNTSWHSIVPGTSRTPPATPQRASCFTTRQVVSGTSTPRNWGAWNG